LLLNRVGRKEIKRIVRPAEAEKLTGYTGTHLRRLEAKGLFPKRFKLNSESGLYGAVGWLESDIEAWMEARAASINPA
jgi:predicted DNA-binding transcriptional regulator AlpA